MKSILAVMMSWKVRPSVEIALIVLFLLLLFSVVGVPMVLVSTFPPSWQRDDLAGDKGEADGVNVLAAPAAL